jgi:hypothetical protein
VIAVSDTGVPAALWQIFQYYTAGLRYISSEPTATVHVQFSATATAASVCANATATAYAGATPTPAPANAFISDAQLGGPTTAFDCGLGAEESEWTMTIAGQPVQVQLGQSSPYQSENGWVRVTQITIANTSGASGSVPAWSPAEDAAIVAPFVPPDATLLKTEAGSGVNGPNHIYMSQRLAISFDPTIFKNAAPGTFYWQCATNQPLCQIGLGNRGISLG